MPHVVLIEPEGLLRSLVRLHLDAMGHDVHVVGNLDEAQALTRGSEGLLVLARGRSDSRYAAELACAFDLHAANEPVRLVVLETGTAALPEGSVAWTYLHAIDRTLACAQLAAIGDEGIDARLGLADDFPHDTYRALARVGELACGSVYLVRNRVSGFKELLVQTCDDQIPAGAVAHALYRNFRMRARPWIDMLRHEVTRHHSFISSSSLPFDLARQVDLAAA